jgi:hypothetical protein
MFSVRACVARVGGAWPVSAASTVKEYAPGAVGVPEITPVEPARESPGGSEPDVSVQLTVPVPPPVVASVWLYAVPAAPPGSAVVRMLNGGGFTNRVNLAWAVAVVTSVTCSVKE